MPIFRFCAAVAFLCASFAAHAAEPADLQSYFPGGKIVKSLSYTAQDGTPRTVVMGGNFGAPALDGIGMNHLALYGLAQTGGQWQTRWEASQSSGDACVIEPLTRHMAVQDPLKQNDPVVLVPYWMGCDSADPSSLELLIYYQDRRYDIHGKLPDEDGTPATHTVSDNFAGLPAALQSHIWTYWNTVEKEAEAADVDASVDTASGAAPADKPQP